MPDWDIEPTIKHAKYPIYFIWDEHLCTWQMTESKVSEFKQSDFYVVTENLIRH